jgi:hypothetical protein
MPAPSQDVKVILRFPEIVSLLTVADPVPEAKQLPNPLTLPGGDVKASES